MTDSELISDLQSQLEYERGSFDKERRQSNEKLEMLYSLYRDMQARMEGMYKLLAEPLRTTLPSPVIVKSVELDEVFIMQELNRIIEHHLAPSSVCCPQIGHCECGAQREKDEVLELIRSIVSNHRTPVEARNV